jgi:chemotaxis response regulator CheB
MHIPITSTYELAKSATTEPVTEASKVNDFPIVCVGGSAGGLDAYIRLLQNFPTDILMQP